MVNDMHVAPGDLVITFESPAVFYKLFDDGPRRMHAEQHNVKDKDIGIVIAGCKMPNDKLNNEGWCFVLFCSSGVMGWVYSSTIQRLNNCDPLKLKVKLCFAE